MSEVEIVYHWANNLFQGYEPIRQPTNTELLVAILNLAKEGMELEDRLKAIEAENAALKEDVESLKQSLEWRDGVIADLRRELKAALERC